ncbi:hypothetical protein VTN96DRAFT_5997 [Rasamsonia emersonii]
MEAMFTFKLSNAELRLNSRVTKISPGRHRRYRLSIAGNQSADAEFDAVALAAPLQSSQVDLGDLGLASIASRLPPYVETHVTHFITPADIDPKFFDPFLNASIPEDLLTATTASHDPDLLSLSRVDLRYRIDCEPGDECGQYVWEKIYRVVSRHVMEDGDLVRMVGRQWHEGSNLSDYDIRWVHRQAWPNAFPRYRSRRALLDEIEIAPGLFYGGCFDGDELSDGEECRWDGILARAFLVSSEEICLVKRSQMHMCIYLLFICMYVHTYSTYKSSIPISNPANERTLNCLHLVRESTVLST